jgi:hypothetical protein
MGDVHRFDRSKRQRFRSDPLMPQIHEMTRRAIDAATHRKTNGLSLWTILLLSGCLFLTILLWPV